MQFKKPNHKVTLCFLALAEFILVVRKIWICQIGCEKAACKPQIAEGKRIFLILYRFIAWFLGYLGYLRWCWQLLWWVGPLVWILEVVPALCLLRSWRGVCCMDPNEGRCSMFSRKVWARKIFCEDPLSSQTQDLSRKQLLPPLQKEDMAKCSRKWRSRSWPILVPVWPSYTKFLDSDHEDCLPSCPAAFQLLGPWNMFEGLV